MRGGGGGWGANKINEGCLLQSFKTVNSSFLCTCKMVKKFNFPVLVISQFLLHKPGKKQTKPFLFFSPFYLFLHHKHTMRLNDYQVLKVDVFLKKRGWDVHSLHIFCSTAIKWQYVLAAYVRLRCHIIKARFFDSILTCPRQHNDKMCAHPSISPLMRATQDLCLGAFHFSSCDPSFAWVCVVFYYFRQSLVAAIETNPFFLPLFGGGGAGGGWWR